MNVSTTRKILITFQQSQGKTTNEHQDQVSQIESDIFLSQTCFLAVGFSFIRPNI